jgi:OTT_1508-like deaminase
MCIAFTRAKNRTILIQSLESLIMAQISVSQKHLSEALRLLHEFRYSDLNMPYQSAGAQSNKDIREPNTHADMRVLDMIAVCLTTGKPGDVVAAAFDKHEGITLVLAKNGDVLPADYTATTTFLSALTRARGWIDLLPFLVRHSKENLDKRIRNLHQSITDLNNDLRSAAAQHPFQTMEEEFPRSERYRRAMYPDQRVTADRVLDDLIRTCRDASTFEMREDQTSFLQYVQLFGAADALQNSRFLLLLTSDPNLTNSERRERAERLKRRLAKICQYARIEQLIKMVKRLPNIPFRWVEGNLIGTGEGTFEICADPMDAVSRGLRGELSSKDMDAVNERFPQLARNWEQWRFINPRIHAELRIILHLSPSLISRSPTDLLPPPAAQLPIGCSKRSCLCCVLWMDAFNYDTGMLWMTSGSHGKPYDNWALPGAASEMEGVRAWRRFDRYVITGVYTRLTDTLTWVRKLTPKRISDEHASSDSDSDSSEGAGDDRIRKIWAGDVVGLPIPMN